MLYTNEQVSSQRDRFESFMNSINLTKVGERYFHFMMHNAHDGRFNEYCYILRVLRMLAKVSGVMYHPDFGSFYNEILTRKSITAFLNSVKTTQPA